MAHVDTKPEAIHNWTDPIVAEVRAARDAIAARHAYDIDRNVRDLLGMPIVGGSSDMQRNNLAGLWRLKG